MYNKKDLSDDTTVFKGDDRGKLAGYNENDKRNLNINTFSSRTCNNYNGIKPNETTYRRHRRVNLLYSTHILSWRCCCENECIFARGYAGKKGRIYLDAKSKTNVVIVSELWTEYVYIFCRLLFSMCICIIWVGIDGVVLPQIIWKLCTINDRCLLSFLRINSNIFNENYITYILTYWSWRS